VSQIISTLGGRSIPLNGYSNLFHSNWTEIIRVHYVSATLNTRYLNVKSIEYLKVYIYESSLVFVLTVKGRYRNF
jgi:hypothetical protein